MEEQIDRIDRAVTVLSDNQFGNIFILRFRIIVSSRYKKATISASCSKEPDSRRSDSIGR